jgi:hypothetical protein
MGQPLAKGKRVKGYGAAGAGVSKESGGYKCEAEGAKRRIISPEEIVNHAAHSPAPMSYSRGKSGYPEMSLILFAYRCGACLVPRLPGGRAFSAVARTGIIIGIAYH